MDDYQLQALVEKLSIEKIGIKFCHRATFNHRLQTTAGRYLLHTHHIEINPLVWEKYGQEELEKVILHELCHYHLHLQKKGYRHRDLAFKTLLKQVGGAKYARPLKEATHLYQCVNCQAQYPRYRRINLQRYRCSSCRGPLQEIK